MKKSSIFLAASAMLVLASCEDDKTPVLNSGLQDTTDAFVLNQPPYADQTINLSDDATLTVSVFQQPDYGFPGSVSYQLFAALDPANLVPAKIQAEDGVVAVETASQPTDRVIVLDQSAVASAMCTLNNMYDDKTWNPDIADAGQKLYLICGASIANQPSTACYSNIISIEKVTFYKAFKTPKRIWIVGSFSAWDVNPGSGTLFMQDKVVDGVNTNIFTGPWKEDESGNVVSASDIPAGSLSWRFYTELTGSWGADGVLPSIGSGPNDFTSVNVDVPASGDIIALPAVPGKGNWDMPGWPGGKLSFRMDMTSDEWELEIIAGDVEDIGDNEGEPTTTDYVTVTVPEDWKVVYAWAWNDTENCTASGSWPGDKLKFSPTLNAYFYQVPAGVGLPTEIIFSNGSIQTINLGYVNNSAYTVDDSNIKQ